MQPKVENFKVTCMKCKGVSKLAVLNNKDVLYQDHVPIISSRLRPDLKWGFECQCGNDSRVSPDEKNNLEFLVQGGAHAIEKIAKSLKPKNERKFKMEPA